MRLFDALGRGAAKRTVKAPGKATGGKATGGKATGGKTTAGKTATVERLVVELDTGPVTVRLNRDGRARRISLRLPTKGNEPVVTVPPKTSSAAALGFIERHRDWLAEKLAARPGLVPFADGAALPLRGVEHRIEHRAGRRGTVWTEAGEGGPLLCVAGGIDHLPRRLTDWLKKEARRDLEDAVAAHAERLGKQPARITLRDTTSRWGSCSARGHLSFSWRLVLAPPEILDYVAAHEVAHLAEMNHSKRFWAIVADLHPGTEKARKWLRRHGHALHAYGHAEG
ncbi:MAG: hypothetical protein C0606_07130 [Hyphomicrobiales bacterium]|nr:MAG: hypothetical protein C0606_07130 [Hyphomicrobiales bacterium]